MASDDSMNFQVTAPGKIILFGEHSVVYGKTALAGSVNLKTKLSFSVASFSNATTISLHLPNIGLHVDFEIKKLEKLIYAPIPLCNSTLQSTFCLENPEKIDFTKLLEKVQEFIKKTVKMPRTPLMEGALSSFLCLLTGMLSTVNVSLVNIRIEVTSQIPIGAGMGSSTAYNVCLAAAFLNYIRVCAEKNLENMTNISRNDYEPFEYLNFDDSTFDNSELDLISRWALVGDKVMHGNPSGIDNAVCTFGGLVEFRKGVRSNTVKMIPDPQYLNLLLVNTKVPRNTKVLVDFVASRRDRFCTVVDSVLDSMDSIAITAAGVLRRMGQLTCLCSKENMEDEAVIDEIEKLEELADINQKLLESLGVSHDSLEYVCLTSRKYGLHAKLTGAGGGGFAFVIIPHNEKDGVIDELSLILGDKGYSAYRVILGGAGVCLMQTFEELESQSKVTDSKEESRQESLLSMSPYQGFLPDLSDSPENDSPIPQAEIQKPWPGPLNYEKLVRKMLDAEKQMKKEKREMPVSTMPESFKDWKDSYKSLWGPVLEKFEKQDRSPKHKGVFKVGGFTIPVEEMQQHGERFMPNVPHHVASGRRTSKKGGMLSTAKGKESKPWPVWKPSVGQTKSPYSGDSVKWLHDQFPVTFDKRENFLSNMHMQRKESRADSLVNDLRRGGCEKSKKRDSFIRKDSSYHNYFSSEKEGNDD